MAVGSSGYGNSGIQAPASTPTGYCTEQDVLYRIPEKYLAQLTNDATGAGSANTATLNDLILQAYDETNGRLADVYEDSLPFSPVPAIIKRINVVLVVYYAMQRQFASMEIPKAWQAEYDRAIKQLDAIANQELTLYGVTVTASTGATMNVDRSEEVNFYDSDSLLSDF